MTLLQAAESLLGPINPWPSNIVNYLFIETPTFWSTIALIAFFMGTPFLALWLYNCFKPVMMIQTFFWHNSFSIFTIYGKNVKMQSVWVFISIWVYRNMSSSMVQIKISSKLLRWETMMIYREALESWIQKSCKTE